MSDCCSSYLDLDKCQKVHRWMEDIKLSEKGSFPHSEKCRQCRLQRLVTEKVMGQLPLASPVNTFLMSLCSQSLVSIEYANLPTERIQYYQIVNSDVSHRW